MAQYKFAKGLQAGYDGIATKDESCVYFCTDSGNIYVGSKQMGSGNSGIKDAELKSSGKVLVFTKADGSTKEVDLESIINGAVIALTGYEKATVSEAIKPTDTVNAAFGKLEKKLDDVGGDALVEVEAGNGVAVSPKVSHKQTISLKIVANEKVLAATTDGLSATLGLNYDSTNRKIQLLGISDAVIAEIDADEFIKDGVLYDQILLVATGASMEVTFPKGDKNTFTGLTSGDPYLFLEFNNTVGKTSTKSFASCNMKALVDEYKAGAGLQLGTGTERFTFSIKIDGTSANGLSVSSTGLSLSLVSDTANGALSSEDYKKFKEAVQSASGEGDTDYVEVTAEKETGTTNVKVQVSAKIQEIASADSTHKGLAAAEDVAAALAWGSF